MSTFHKIVNNVLHIDNNIFANTYQPHDEINNIHKVFLSNLCSDHYLKYYKSKFVYVNVCLHNFYFAKFPDLKAKYLDLFYTIQKHYHVLNRFVHAYKYKKSKILINTDLQLNEISQNDMNVITIYHTNSRYLFKIEELLKIIYVSLTNTSSFFSEPITIKNPYNNIPFDKSTLFHIYIFLMNKAKICFIKTDYLEVFFQFKKYNFNLTKFMDHNEPSIRNYALKDYLKNSKIDILYDNINDILLNYNRGLPKSRQITISSDFPKSKLVEVFKPFLHLHLLSKYSLNPKIKMDAKYFIEHKLNEFQSYNPQFGRKYVKYKIIKEDVSDGEEHFKQKRKVYSEYDTKHKSFYIGKTKQFMNNHIDYQYNYYEGIIDDNMETDENENMEYMERYININININNNMDSDTETIISYNSDDDNDTIIENTTQQNQSIQSSQPIQPIRNRYLYHLRQGNIRSNEIADIIERIAANVFQQNEQTQNQDSENSDDSHDTDDDDIHRNDIIHNDTDTDTDTDNNDILDDNESIS